MIAGLVYILCGVTSALCFWMLYRKYRESQIRLLFWSSVCFFFLALSNVILFADMVIYPDIDLSIFRIIPSLLGASALIYGLIGESV